MAAPIKVLFVEDDVEIRNAYSYCLGQAGFQVLLAANAEEGLHLLTQHHPEVMILDMLMPGISGLEFLRQHDVHIHFPKTKILAFSNIDSPKVMAEAKELGVIQYLIKVDVTPHQMTDMVRKLT